MLCVAAGDNDGSLGTAGWWMADQKVVTEARVRLGATLARLRGAAGFTQEQFAPLTQYGRSTVANVEVGRQRVHREFWQNCDNALGTDGSLAAEHDRVEALRQDHQRTNALALTTKATHGDAEGDPDPDRLLMLISHLCHQPKSVAMPPGQYFGGTDLEVRVFPAVADGRILTQVPIGFGGDPFIARNRRGLLIGAIGDREEARLYGLDNRSARRKLGAGGVTRLVMPAAYLLDEITLGLLWAVSSMDAALLDDDKPLDEYHAFLAGEAGISRPALSFAAAAQLTAASAMWLGSDFCARHILANIDRIDAIPVFWTREQRGEEASAWLFFKHKYDYLQQLAARFGKGMSRTFCIPDHALASSAASERVLILLVAALMESFGIVCHVTCEAEYATMDGFVLDAQRQAIVANWVRAEGIWHVDITSNRGAVREYADAQAYVSTHLTTGADSPTGRLRALCEYLALDWAPITIRCAELAEYGLDGIAAPRSRLLSLAGADRACQFLASLKTPAR